MQTFKNRVLFLWISSALLFLGTACSGFVRTGSGESGSNLQNNVPLGTDPTSPEGRPRGPATSSGGKGALGILPGRSAAKELSADLGSKYYVYVPTKYKEDTPIGMVMIFHGVSSEPSDYFQILRDFANNDRFILVAPAGDPEDGAGGAYCQPFSREIMVAVRAAFNIDDSKQYITGHSAGSSTAVYLGMASVERTAENACGQKIQIGYQAEFAGIGFSSPVASVPGATLPSKTPAELGFTPVMWSEYGELSADGPKATALSQYGKTKGYSPSTLVERKGEGHTPAQPFSNYKKMFDLFESSTK